MGLHILLFCVWLVISLFLCPPALIKTGSISVASAVICLGLLNSQLLVSVVDPTPSILIIYFIY